MKLIESNVEYIPQAEGLEGIYKQIELAGRTAYKSSPKVIDHADIVVTHHCDNHCTFCVDKFINSSDDVVSLESVEKFLKVIKRHSKEDTEVLLLGGEPTSIGIEKLKDIANTIRTYGFLPIISTNTRNRNLAAELTKYFTWVQVTIHKFEDIEFYATYRDRINIKLAGDKALTLEKFNRFIELTKDYERRSISMYFTPDFKELCTDEGVWKILNTLDWKQNGSYLYAFYEGVRIKRCITGKTNIIDEPSVPKLYPNGNYNKTWCNENHDPYLDNSSSKDFVDRMIKLGHGACLEHGTVYMKIPDKIFQRDIFKWKLMFPSGCPYVHMNSNGICYYITTNYRYILESGIDIETIQKFFCEPSITHEKRYTFKFTCDRGISHELVRHRTFSFLQESTRYCNYMMDKFGNEVTFIEPSSYCEMMTHAFKNAEDAYMMLIDAGWTPQQARAVLPNALKTELIMTGFSSGWRNLLDIRYFEKTGKVHPDMAQLMQKLSSLMHVTGVWDDVMKYPSKFD